MCVSVYVLDCVRTMTCACVVYKWVSMRSYILGYVVCVYIRKFVCVCVNGFVCGLCFEYVRVFACMGKFVSP